MKKTFTLLLTAVALVFALTGCGRSDIGITLNKNGTGSVAASFGIEKNAYEQMKATGIDVFEGKTTTEQKYSDNTYVTYTETTEYGSYAEIKNALLELTYNTGELDNLIDMGAVPALDQSGNVQTKEDERVFASVDIDRTAGIFYSVYTFKATVNPIEIGNSAMSSGDVFKTTITVNMPYKISQSKGGVVNGKTVVFDINNLNGSTEIAAVSEANHYGVVLGICGGLVVIVAVLFILVKRKK